MKLQDLTSKKFGCLTVLYRLSASRTGATRWRCRCDCGTERDVFATHLIQGNSKSCGQCGIKKGQSHPQWNGEGELSGHFWASTVVRSANGSKGRRRILPLTITKKYAWKLFIRQDRKCALTGLDITLPSSHRDRTWTASLDRIDSSKGYIKGNVQWIHKDLNMMKRTYSQDYFIKMCSLVAKKHIS